MEEYEINLNESTTYIDDRNGIRGDRRGLLIQCRTFRYRSAAATLSPPTSGASAAASPSGASVAASPSGASVAASPLAATAAALPAAKADGSPGGGTPITITAGDRTITASLNNSAVAREFVAMLPVTLPWFRSIGIEYITELSAPLNETGPFYTDVRPGDIVYYNPRDSITIIYAPTSSVPTLTKMGEITSDLNVFRELPDRVDMRIEVR